MTVSYREHPPPRVLAPWVACGWELEVAEPAGHRVLPDGCVDLVWSEREGARVVGVNSRAFVAAIPAGGSAAGVRFRPGAGPAFLRADGRGLRDAEVPWGERDPRLEADLADGHPPLASLFAVVCAHLPAAAAPDPLVRAVAARLAAAPATRIGGLAARLGVSERQLRRRVEVAVGYGPKRLARVLRLHRALAEARAGAELAQAALLAGYADQAHLANECRALGGAPATALLAA